jgi:hypothetical protein
MPLADAVIVVSVAMEPVPLTMTNNKSPAVGVNELDGYDVTFAVEPVRSRSTITLFLILAEDESLMVIAQLSDADTLLMILTLEDSVMVTAVDSAPVIGVMETSRSLTVARVPRLAVASVASMCVAAVAVPVVTEPLTTTDPTCGLVPLVTFSPTSVTVPQALTPVAVHDSAEKVVDADAIVVQAPITASFAISPGFEPSVMSCAPETVADTPYTPVAAAMSQFVPAVLV